MATALVIGSDVTVGHGAILHACTIGDRCLIGMGAIVMDGVVLEPGVLIAGGAVVTARHRPAFLLQVLAEVLSKCAGGFVAPAPRTTCG